MTTLTKEHFDQRMKRIDDRFDRVDNRLDGVDGRLDGLETQIEAVRTNLLKEVQDLAVITARGFADLEKRLDVREDVRALDTRVKKIESALQL